MAQYQTDHACIHPQNSIAGLRPSACKCVRPPRAPVLTLGKLFPAYLQELHLDGLTPSNKQQAHHSENFDGSSSRMQGISVRMHGNRHCRNGSRNCSKMHGLPVSMQGGNFLHALRKLVISMTARCTGFLCAHRRDFSLNACRHWVLAMTLRCTWFVRESKGTHGDAVTKILRKTRKTSRVRMMGSFNARAISACHSCMSRW